MNIIRHMYLINYATAMEYTSQYSLWWCFNHNGEWAVMYVEHKINHGSEWIDEKQWLP